MNKVAFLAMAACIVLVFSGCSWFESQQEPTAQELIHNGMDEYRQGNYKTAISNFEKLKDWYPFSKYAILAELKIADAHYHLQEYDEAIFAYEEFENLHPRNEAIPYVIYQIGRCHFDRLGEIDRDPTFARKALTTFSRLSNRFPNDAYAQRAQHHALKCFQNLAGHEFYVGLFYYKSEHYEAALSRFQAVVTQYPDVGVHQDALRYITLCQASLKEQADQ